eukprot:Gregarina_sp_Poly_1__700@NODE_1167_length_4875_cov_37_248128_g800_i0_p1_GENE_NODE_1167_length_4875_cov_37_248128_g800_i0NODE_1167_length_4875_cov_37_248128_g800_i0_p1_ORF_typecomplete_len1053_score135_44_NODE_1167_length_4875_cov_37_248128_g800_i017164547
MKTPRRRRHSATAEKETLRGRRRPKALKTGTPRTRISRGVVDSFSSDETTSKREEAETDHSGEEVRLPTISRRGKRISRKVKKARRTSGNYQTTFVSELTKVEPLVTARCEADSSVSLEEMQKVCDTPLLPVRLKREVRILSLSDFVARSQVFAIQCNPSMKRFTGSILGPLLDDSIYHLFITVGDGDVWVALVDKSISQTLMPERVGLKYSLGFELLKMQDNDSLLRVPFVQLSQSPIGEDLLNLPVRLRSSIVAISQSAFGTYTILIQAMTNLLLVWAVSVSGGPALIGIIQMPTGSEKQECLSVLPHPQHPDSAWVEVVTALSVVSCDTPTGQLCHAFVGTSTGRVLSVSFDISVGNPPGFSFSTSVWLRQVMTHTAVHGVRTREVVNDEILSSVMSFVPSALWVLVMNGSHLEAWKIVLQQDGSENMPRVVDRWQCSDGSPLPLTFRGFAIYVTQDSRLGVLACDHKTHLYSCVVGAAEKEWARLSDAQSFASTTVLTAWTESKLQELYDSLTISSVPESQKSTLNHTAHANYFADLHGTLLVSSHTLHIYGDLCLALSPSNPLTEFIGTALLGLEKSGFSMRYLRNWLMTLSFAIRGRREPNLLLQDLLTIHASNESEPSSFESSSPYTLLALFNFVSRTLLQGAEVSDIMSDSAQETSTDLTLKNYHANFDSTELLPMLEMIKASFDAECLKQNYEDIRLAVVLTAYCYMRANEELNAASKTLMNNRSAVMFGDLLVAVLTLFVSTRDQLRSSTIRTSSTRRKTDLINKFFDLSHLIFALRGLAFKPPNSVVSAQDNVIILPLHPDLEIFDKLALSFLSRMLLSTFLAADPENANRRHENVCQAFLLPQLFSESEKVVRSRCSACIDSLLFVGSADITPTARDGSDNYSLESFFRLSSETRKPRTYCPHCMVGIELHCEWINSESCLLCSGSAEYVH